MRILRQIGRRVAAAVLSFPAWILTALCFAVAGAFFVPSDSWGARAEDGLLASLISLLLILVAATVWQGLLYLRERGARRWQIKASVAGNAIKIQLERNPDTLVGGFDEHGALLCEVKSPSGVLFVPDIHPGAVLEAAGPLDFVHARFVLVGSNPPELGRYEVRWYGSTAPNKLFELISGSLEVTQIGQIVTGRPRRSLRSLS